MMLASSAPRSATSSTDTNQQYAKQLSFLIEAHIASIYIAISSAMPRPHDVLPASSAGLCGLIDREGRSPFRPMVTEHCPLRDTS